MSELTISEVARMGGNAIKQKNPKQFSEMGKRSGEIRRQKSKKNLATSPN